MKYVLIEQSEGSKFWEEELTKKKICEKKFTQNNPLYHKAILWKFCKKSLEMEPYTMTIAKNKFSYYKENYEAKYVMLNNCILSVLEPRAAEHPYGFRLTHNGISKEFFCDQKEEIELWHSKLRKYCIQTNFEEEYQLIKRLGAGNFSAVYEGKSLRDEQSYAIKVIEKWEILGSAKHMVSLKSEVTALREINHPRVVKMFDIFENPKRIYIIFELIKGGELFERLKKKKTYKEEQAAIVIKQLMEALIYLEKKHIIHRDIKLENIMLVHEENDCDIKIVDFGLSTTIEKVDPNVRCGTPGYVAPEVISGGHYDYKSDIFSCGVVLYILLSGCVPFPGEDFDEILKRNKRSRLKFSSKYWKNISFEGIDLVMRMLSSDPKHRPTAEEVLKSSWIAKYTGDANSFLEYSQQTIESASDSELDKNIYHKETLPPATNTTSATFDLRGGNGFQRKHSLGDAVNNFQKRSLSMHKMAIQRTLLLQKLKTFEADVNTDDGANSPVHFEIDSNLNFSSFYKAGLSQVQNRSLNESNNSNAMIINESVLNRNPSIKGLSQEILAYSQSRILIGLEENAENVEGETHNIPEMIEELNITYFDSKPLFGKKAQSEQKPIQPPDFDFSFRAAFTLPVFEDHSKDKKPATSMKW